ncbi:hypothetical protein [Pseudomonas amygdali]|uniref:hypothetical protein n=1 Tax=Pseudomonas amygdali TaxID=47877 RepID=UPI000A64A7E8|nr:hypothetical protein [Pseudomonas amygdali]
MMNSQVSGNAFYCTGFFLLFSAASASADAAGSNRAETSFKTVEVDGYSYKLATTQIIENGKSLICEQYIGSVERGVDGRSQTVSIKNSCQTD